MYAILWQENTEFRTRYNVGKAGGYATKKEATETAEIIAKGYDYEIILYSEIPSDRRFRSTWTHDKTSSPQKISVNVALARDVSLVKVRANVLDAFIELNREAQIAMSDGMTLDEARELTKVRGDILKAATDQLKALDVNKDGIISVEEAAGLLLPLELIKNDIIE